MNRTVTRWVFVPGIGYQRVTVNVGPRRESRTERQQRITRNLQRNHHA